jgi:hypothetical protein
MYGISQMKGMAYARTSRLSCGNPGLSKTWAGTWGDSRDTTLHPPPDDIYPNTTQFQNSKLEMHVPSGTPQVRAQTWQSDEVVEDIAKCCSSAKSKMRLVCTLVGYMAVHWSVVSLPWTRPAKRIIVQSIRAYRPALLNAASDCYLILRKHNLSKQLVGMLVCIELWIHTPGGSKSILLGKPNVVKEGPQHIIAVAIVVLVHSIFIQEDRNATLDPHNIQR